ncbi:M20 family metallopeptidase [Staphylococcus arlettae]|uniref:M20 family metallopeptidase n=1 Tax=Staphylococcus arlettae TaxID=29378 RepID=UPI0011AB0E37|nr:M20/M25/M40 family metallo-hydrolase [Staphylococcus arlettae]
MDKTIKLLQELITYDSSHKTVANDTIEYCKTWLEQENLAPQIISNNGFKMLLCEVGQGEQTLILNGHVDVVSGKDSQFNPEIKDNRIYGRGSADMKAGVAAMMGALVELNDARLTNVKVQLHLMTDEEIGGVNCADYLTTAGHLGDFVICAEPTQLGIGIQAKGILQFNLTITGVAAHSSRPWEGTNAIAKSMAIYEQILDLPFAQEQSDFYDGPSINLAKISGGDVYNKVPDTCKLSFDIRYLPTQNRAAIIEQIKGLTDSQLDIHLEGPPVLTNKDNPYIQKLIKTIKTHTLEDSVAVFGQHGFADTRYYARYNVPAIEFGPAGAHWHGDDEYAELASIEKYQAMLVSFAQQL